MVSSQFHYTKQNRFMPFLLAEILNFQGSTHRIGVGSFSYVIKAEGEMLVGRKFVAYTDTMKTWEPPHENEKISKEQIERIIREVQKSMNKNTVQIIFE